MQPAGLPAFLVAPPMLTVRTRRQNLGATTPDINTMAQNNEAKTRAQKRANAARASLDNVGAAITKLTAEIKSKQARYNDLYSKFAEANRALKAATGENPEGRPTIRELDHRHYLPAEVFNLQYEWYEEAKAEAAATVANDNQARSSEAGEEQSGVESATLDD